MSVKTPRFEGPFKWSTVRAGLLSLREDVQSIEKVPGRNVTIDEHHGKGKVINVARERGASPPPSGCEDVQRFAVTAHIWFALGELTFDFTDTQNLILHPADFYCAQTFDWVCGSPDGTNQNCMYPEGGGNAPLGDVGFECDDPGAPLPDYFGGYGISLLHYLGEYYLTVTFTLFGTICGSDVGGIYGSTFPINDNLGSDPSGLHSYSTPHPIYTDVTLTPV